MSLMPRWTSLVNSCLLTVVATVHVGCAHRATRPVFVESPLPLIAGGALVTPIQMGGAAWDRPQDDAPGPILLGDGQRIETSVRRYGYQQGGAGEHGWLGPSGQWRAMVRPSEDSTTLLFARVPESGLGQSAWMDGRRIPAFWLLPDMQGDNGRQPKPTGPVISRDQAIDLLEGELTDPTIRWRAELALDRLGYEPPPSDWQDDVLHGWAEQSADRWRAGIQRLHEIEPLVASRLTDALTRWLVAGDIALPVWPTDVQGINDLVLTILRPGASDESVIRAVQAFLDRQPQWLAWVANDAGGVVGGAIAVVNLSWAPALLSTRPPMGRWEAYGMLEPGEMALVPAPPRPGVGSEPSVWEVRLGGRTRSIELTTNALDLTPPGLPIGPFWRDWTLDGLVSQTAQATSPGQNGWIGGLLQRDTRFNAPASSENGWVLYMEIRRPPCELPAPGAPAPQLDAVRLAFGPSDRPRAEVIVRCSGLTTFERGAPANGAILSTDGDRWAFTLPIDRAWLEPDGTILFGAQFLPHDGPRATWPRPVLPGQETIGRVRLDPSAWDLRIGPVEAAAAP